MLARKREKSTRVIIRNATLVPMVNNLSNTATSQAQIIHKGALVYDKRTIKWVGKQSELPKELRKNAEEIDAEGKCVTPGLIDCHTHLVYGGHRAQEFFQRQMGSSYETLLAQGGGILSTVKATRSLSERGLLDASLPRLKKLIKEGVTTLEIKSGYGLDEKTELLMLNVAHLLKFYAPVRVDVYRTLLAAHALPAEFSDKDAYIDWICDHLLPKVAAKKLAQAVDVFCEKIAFNLPQTEKIFKRAQTLGLAIKCHAEQLSWMGGAQLAARYQAVSIDHGEYLTEDDIQALQQSNTAVVLLPGAYYFMRCQQRPPIELLRRYQVPMAIATDCNPGTSPTTSLLWMMNMACVLFDLTPWEAWHGVTINAAKALGLSKKLGSLAPGKQADILIWSCEDPLQIIYAPGQILSDRIIKAGQSLYTSFVMEDEIWD